MSAIYREHGHQDVEVHGQIRNKHEHQVKAYQQLTFLFTQDIRCLSASAFLYYPSSYNEYFVIVALPFYNVPIQQR